MSTGAALIDSTIEVDPQEACDLVSPLRADLTQEFRQPGPIVQVQVRVVFHKAALPVQGQQIELSTADFTGTEGVLDRTARATAPLRRLRFESRVRAIPTARPERLLRRVRSVCTFRETPLVAQPILPRT